MKKQNRGITLIALVITIIVLIILAGITINLTIGEGGILKRAQEARINYIQAAEDEKTQLDEVLNEIDKIMGNETSGDITSGGNEEETVVVTLNKTSTEILVATTETLTATVESNNEINKTVKWTSNNEKVATVDENGVVTGVSAGITEIVATTEDGGKTASCSVRVRDIENIIRYHEASPIYTIFNKAKELGYVTQYNIGYQSIISAPVTEYGIAFYEFSCLNSEQESRGGIRHDSLDYETMIQGAPGTDEWLNRWEPDDTEAGGDHENYFGYLGPKALQNGETKFLARARVFPNTPFQELEQVCHYNINIVSQTDFLNAAQALGINNGMELIYSAFENYSWEELGKVAEEISNDETITIDTLKVSKVVDGKTYELEVGELTKVKYNGITKTVRINGFNHDTLTNTEAYGKGKTNTVAGISFEFISPMIENVPINSTNDNTNGWGGCTLRSTLNSETELNKLENVGQIKQVNKTYLLGNKSTTTQISYDKIWLLSRSERRQFGDGSEFDKEGKQYKYYKDVSNTYNFWITANSHAIEREYDGWLRTPYYNNNTSFYIMSLYGSDYGNASKSDVNVAPGFAI